MPENIATTLIRRHFVRDWGHLAHLLAPIRVQLALRGPLYAATCAFNLVPEEGAASPSTATTAETAVAAFGRAAERARGGRQKQHADEQSTKSYYNAYSTHLLNGRGKKASAMVFLNKLALSSLSERRESYCLL